MFEQSIVNGTKTKKGWAVLVSFGIQISFLVVLIVLPLIFFEGLPAAQLKSWLTPPPPPSAPPPPAAAPPVRVVKVIPRQFIDNRLTAPKIIPKEVVVIKEEEQQPPFQGHYVPGAPGNSGDGKGGDIVDRIIGAVPTAAPPPPPPPPPPTKKSVEPTTPQRIKIGGQVQQSKLVRHAQPIYPPLAKQIRLSGTVELTAIIGIDGTIQKLQVVSGHPMLIPAAMEAVRQWTYQPSLLNGEPVEVITQIQVIFKLQ